MLNSRSLGQTPTYRSPVQRLVQSDLLRAATATVIAGLAFSAASPSVAQVRDAAAASVPRVADQAASSVSLVEGFAYMGVTFSLIALALMLLSPRLWDREPPH